MLSEQERKAIQEFIKSGGNFIHIKEPIRDINAPCYDHIFSPEGNRYLVQLLSGDYKGVLRHRVITIAYMEQDSFTSFSFTIWNPDRFQDHWHRQSHVLTAVARFNAGQIITAVTSATSRENMSKFVEEIRNIIRVSKLPKKTSTIN